MTIRQQWNALLGRLGLEPSAGVAVDNDCIERFCAEEPAPDETPGTDAEQARRTAPPTRTAPKEDPSPAEPVRSPNATAYDEDIRNFR